MPTTKPNTTASGFDQRDATAKAAQRAARELLPRGRRSLFTYEPADFKVVHRGTNGELSTLSGLSTNLGWTEDSSNSGGSLSITQHQDDDLRLEEGDRILVQSATPGDRFSDLLAMRVVEPQQAIEGGSTSATLETELGVLQRFKRDWRFPKDRRHPKGWLAHEIVAEVCRQAGVPSATLVKGRVHQTLTRRYASATAIIVAAYKRERQGTGRRYLVDMRGGRVNVRTPKRSSSVPVYGPLVRSAQVTRRWPKDFATELIVTARVNGKQTEIVVPNLPLARRYGRITDTASYGTMSSRAAVRARARRELAARSLMTKEVSFTHPGVLSLRRGDQIVLELPGYTFGFPMFVASLSHTVTPGDHEMTVDCTFDDPIPDSAGDRIRETNGRDGTPSATRTATTAKAKQRATKGRA